MFSITAGSSLGKQVVKYSASPLAPPGKTGSQIFSITVGFSLGKQVVKYSASSLGSTWKSR
jgi:hypothetical protein